MRILIGVDGSASSLDAVRMAGRLVDPARDDVAVYFSPMELEKRLLGRSRRIVDGAGERRPRVARGQRIDADRGRDRVEREVERRRKRGVARGVTLPHLEHVHSLDRLERR